MQTLSQTVTAAPAGTFPALLVGLAGAAAAALVLAGASGLGPVFAATAVAAYCGVAAAVAATIGRSHGAPVFGLPNAVTLARVIAAALVVGYAADVAAGLRPSAMLATGLAVLAAAAIAADGVDGWLARTRGPATPFGARFDMEIDALLLLALSLLAFGLGKAGVWVIGIGGIRYLFVAAALPAPWLAAPLPPSFRRKAVCVLQGAALTLLALPVVGGAPAVALAALALVALVWSFGVDVIWLARARRSGGP